VLSDGEDGAPVEESHQFNIKEGEMTMKPKQSLLVTTMIIVAMFPLVFLLASSPLVVAQDSITITPQPFPVDEDVELPLRTPEFIPTPVPLPKVLGVPEIRPVLKLDRPLTRGQALRKALELDQNGAARWENEGWSLETQSSQPDRIKVERYEEGKYQALGTSDLNKGAIWVITIKGRVRVQGIGWSCLCSGVTYGFSEETGDFIFISGVPPVLELKAF